MAKRTVRATWQSDMKFEVDASSGITVPLDNTPGPQARDGGSPQEMLLVALAGCIGMDVLGIVQKKRQAVTGCEVQVSGQRAREYPKVYTDIDVLFIFEGEDLDPAAIERAIELSTTRYCPVWATLKHTAELSSRYEIREETQQPG